MIYRNVLVGLALFSQIGFAPTVNATDVSTKATPTARGMDPAPSTTIGPGQTPGYKLKSITQGWSLLGVSSGTPVDIKAVFGTVDGNNIPGVTSNITTVWKWSIVNSGWQFWTPLMTAADLATYATSKGYEVLSVLQPGDGYWVNAKATVTLNDFASASTKLGSFSALRKVDSNCHGYSFNPHDADLTVAISGSQLTLTEDDFFDKRCVYTAATINSPLTGTFRCANNAFDEGTFTLTGDRQNDANDIRLVMDVVTTSRSCNYNVKFIGFRK